MTLSRIATVSATLALAAQRAACGGGVFDSSPGAVTPPTFPTAPQIASTNFASGEFTAINFGCYIAYPQDATTEVANGAITVRRASDLSRAITGQFSLLRLGRADS